MAKPDFGTQKKVIAQMKYQGYSKKARTAVLDIYCGSTKHKKTIITKLKEKKEQ